MKKKLIIIVLLICALLSIPGCSGIDADSTFNIQFIDVGQGDSALIECDGHYMLIDGGPASSGDKVYDVLKENNVEELDILVASHPDEDHIGGLTKALTYASKINLTLSNCDYKNSKCFQDFKHQLSINESKIKIPKVGKEYKLGSAKIEILDIASSNTNDSLIFLITYGKNTFLFAGDTQQNMESRLCDKYNDEFPVDLLKVSHHGSETSTSIRFLRMLMPKYSIISVGKNNPYGHPTEQTLSRLEQEKSKVYRTDLEGDIFVQSNGESISVRTSK